MGEWRPPHAAVVLAAGRSRRFGAPKQLLRIEGETLVQRAVDAARATAPEDVIVVVDREAQAIRDALAGQAVRWVECADDHMAASLRAGVSALDACIGAALIVLADQPALTTRHLCSLVEAWRAAPERAAASAYAGTLGVPAVLPAAWFARLAEQADGDEGARALLRDARADVIALEAADLALDIDTPADFERWLARRGNAAAD